MRSSRIIEGNRGQGVQARFLLANRAGRHKPVGPALQRLPTICNAEAHAGVSTQDDPCHLAICRLGIGHGRPVEEVQRRHDTLAGGCGQVHEVDRS